MAKGKGADQGGSRLENKGKGKGKGKEVKPLLEAKGPEATLKLKNAAPKAKDARQMRLILNPRKLIPRPPTLLSPSRASKITLLQPRHNFGSFSFTYYYYFFICNFPLLWQFAMFKMYLLS